LANFAEAGCQGARGWVDMVAVVGDWEFSLEDVTGEVRIWHGRGDRTEPAGHGEYLAAHLPTRPCAGSRTPPSATAPWTCSIW
jgi:hypothetical protein